MVNVECPGCGAPYSVSENRIPDAGLQMRCPKCGESFPVAKPAGGGPPPVPAAPARQPKLTLPGHMHPAGGHGLPPAGSSTGGRRLPGAGAPPPPPSKKPIFAAGSQGHAASNHLSAEGEDAQSWTPHAGGVDVPGLGDIGNAPIDDGFGALDLDLPGQEPTGPGGVTDLPMPSHQADLPQVAPPQPAQHDDLPMAAGYADLPMAASHADLPMPIDHGNLPVAADQDLPLPVPDSDLPMSALHDDLPMPVDENLPVARMDSDLPLPADQDLPLPADQDLPLPADDQDLPLPTDFNLPTAFDDDSSGAAIGGGVVGDEFGEMPLPDDDLLAPAADFDAKPVDDAFSADLESVRPPPPQPPKREGDAVGDEFAIDEVEEEPADLLDQQDGPQPVPTEEAEQPRVKVKRKRSRAMRIAIAAIPLLAIGGGLLSLTPVGPYGYHAISDALNRESHTNRLATFRQEAQEQLAADTSVEAQALLDRARSEQSQMARYRPMTAYTAYLAFIRSIRFGPDSAAIAAGRQLLDTVPSEATGDLLTLARTARTAADGQVDAASQQLNSLLASMEGDVDVLVLAGEVALLGAQPKDALALWKQAVDADKCARTLYGLARTEFALGNKEGALEHANAVLKLSKNHAGGRVLLAELLWHEDKKSVKALELLEAITTEGPARAAASKSELVTAYSLLGDIQLSQSKLTSAEKSFAAALKLDPQSQRALVGNGELFFNAGRYSEALARYEAAFRFNPQNVLAVVGKAKTKIALERAKDAKTQLLPLAKTSKHPLVGYWLGQAHEALGDREAAEKIYRQTIETGTKKHSDMVHPYVALANLLNARGDEEQAKKVLAEASETLPTNAALFNAKGDVALRNGRLDVAKAEFVAALEIEPDNSGSRFRLAITHRRLREFDQAAKQYANVAKNDPEYPGLALERGLLFEETGETDKALKMYNDALKLAPDDVDLKLRVGSTQVISGHPRQAISLLRKVLSKRPTSGEVNHFLGRALLLAGEPAEEALRYLQTAVRYDENRAEYHLYVAWAGNSAGRPDIAEAAIDRTLQLDANLGDAYWQRAVWLQKRGATVDAIKELDKAIELNPSRFEAYATRARCLSDQTKYNEAEEAWKTAIEGNPNMPDWRFRLGKILMDRNATGEAAPHLRAAVDLTMERKQTPGWLWNANWLLGEAVRATDPKRAVIAYREFLRLTPSDNAYRADAKQAIEQLEDD